MNFDFLTENYTKVSYKRAVSESVVPIVVDIPKKRYWITTLKIVGIAAAFVFMPDIVFASGIDERAKELYFGKFIGIAKWIVVFKGAWDTVSRAMKEDFEGAKRSILQYALIFAVLMGLPWLLDEIENFFREV